MQTAWGLLKQSFEEWNANSVPRLGAALAYYSVFAISPLLLIVIAVASSIFGAEASQKNIVGQIEGTVGEPVAKAIQDMLEKNAAENQNATATIIGVIILLAGAAGVFGQLQDALDIIWKVEPKPSRGFLGMLRDRFVSLTMVLGSAFLLLVSLVVHAFLSGMSERLNESMPGGAAMWGVINFVVSFAVMTGVFMLIFKYVPDAKTAWGDVWIGALLTAVLFVLGKSLLGWYLGRESTTSGYGAAGSLIVILLWVYYASQILLFGACFTRVYATTLGSGVTPTSNAVSTEGKERPGNDGQTPSKERQPVASDRR